MMTKAIIDLILDMSSSTRNTFFYSKLLNRFFRLLENFRDLVGGRLSLDLNHESS